MAKVKGLDTVIKNLNKEINGLRQRTYSGLLAGGAFLEGAAKKKTPLVTGNLRASGYHRGLQKNPPAVEIGFSAAYAVFVHENLEQKLKGKPRPKSAGGGTYWDKGEPKFLENALLENQRKIFDIVKSHAEVK